ncbi:MULTISPECIES: hypothetical protein [Brochothrix]|uniref:Uncharacterized protein n=1 Tax=Brochothrix thermosphacta TaxID=2756 RepID=A0A1D2LRU7_BROTH|nr:MULTISPECIES: hypothetical protein [Brochothrix]ANZ97527.1 hypothetical protein BFC20_07400 [Brochothrix thermosphacta]ATF26970.1 hypothetical protein CNY62_11715 [Brochothrix thermosphacta]ATH86327.1 hypothetical protein CPF12_11395 [Brochothrix thermosphacta]MBR5526909.1 hypothetical protein [Brochothrix sp.]MDO7862890.1 hypothetical protein [Brochothrix thermosphacta]
MSKKNILISTVVLFIAIGSLAYFMFILPPKTSYIKMHKLASTEESSAHMMGFDYKLNKNDMTKKAIALTLEHYTKGEYIKSFEPVIITVSEANYFTISVSPVEKNRVYLSVRNQYTTSSWEPSFVEHKHQMASMIDNVVTGKTSLSEKEVVIGYLNIVTSTQGMLDSSVDQNRKLVKEADGKTKQSLAKFDELYVFKAKLIDDKINK